MTPEQAITILEQVRLNFSAGGADHDKIREAVQVLSELVNKQPK